MSLHPANTMVVLSKENVRQAGEIRRLKKQLSTARVYLVLIEQTTSELEINNLATEGLEMTEEKQ